MKNKRLLCLVLVIVMAIFATGCGEDQPSKPKVSNVPQLAISAASSVTVKKTIEVTVRLGAGTGSDLETCGYQFELKYPDGFVFDTISNAQSCFELVSNDNHGNVRVMAIPVNKDSKLTVPKNAKDKDNSLNLVTFKFMAPGKTSKNNVFSLGKVDATDFATVVTKWNNNTTIAESALTVGADAKVEVKSK